MTFSNGQDVQYRINDRSEWKDATYIGPAEGLHVVISKIFKDVHLVHEREVRVKPIPRFNYVLVWRNKNNPLEIAACCFPTDGAARQYAFDSQMNVVCIMPVEL